MYVIGEGLASEGEVAAAIGAVGPDDEVAAPQVFVEAVDLIAVTSLKEVQDVMEEVVNLLNRSCLRGSYVNSRSRPLAPWLLSYQPLALFGSPSPAWIKENTHTIGPLKGPRLRERARRVVYAPPNSQSISAERPPMRKKS